QKEVADDGETVTVSAGGVTATLVNARDDGRRAGIVVAVVPPSTAALAGLMAQIPPGELLSASYDVRTFNIGPEDYATVTFHYQGDADDVPDLLYLNPLTGAVEKVSAGLYVLDQEARTITLRLDRFSNPHLADLHGTVFA